MPQPLQESLFALASNLVKNVENAERELSLAMESTLPALTAIRSFREDLVPVQASLKEVEDHLAIVRSRHEVERPPPDQGAGDESACSICLEGPPSKRCNWEAVCRHKFHKACIESYFNSRVTHVPCPFCRIPIIEEDFWAPYVQNENTDEAWEDCLAALCDASFAIMGFKVWVNTSLTRCSNRINSSADRDGSTPLTGFFVDCFLNSPLTSIKSSFSGIYNEMNRFRMLRSGGSPEEAESIPQQTL